MTKQCFHVSTCTFQASSFIPSIFQASNLENIPSDLPSSTFPASNLENLSLDLPSLQPGKSSFYLPSSKPLIWKIFLLPSIFQASNMWNLPSKRQTWKIFLASLLLTLESVRTTSLISTQNLIFFLSSTNYHSSFFILNQSSSFFFILHTSSFSWSFFS